MATSGYDEIMNQGNPLENPYRLGARHVAVILLLLCIIAGAIYFASTKSSDQVREQASDQQPKPVDVSVTQPQSQQQQPQQAQAPQAQSQFSTQGTQQNSRVGPMYLRGADPRLGLSPNVGSGNSDNDEPVNLGDILNATDQHGRF